MAVAEASLRISTDSMSDVLIMLMLPGNPLMIHRGSLSPLIELAPRMRTWMAAPGCPLSWLICTPETRPWSACATETLANSLIRSPLTWATAPERSRLRCTP